jgi:hypothetical protein
MAEKRIRDLQDLARAMLLHVSTKWNTHITANLWPYAIRMANEVLNSTHCPQLETRRTPQQVFDQTKVLPNPKHLQPFGCPVYVLATPLQAGMRELSQVEGKSSSGHLSGNVSIAWTKCCLGTRPGHRPSQSTAQCPVRFELWYSEIL